MAEKKVGHRLKQTLYNTVDKINRECISRSEKKTRVKADHNYVEIMTEGVKKGKIIRLFLVKMEV